MWVYVYVKKVKIQYLPLLYLGGYYLSALLYDINQQVALLEQFVFLSRRIYLDRSRNKKVFLNFFSADGKI